MIGIAPSEPMEPDLERVAPLHELLAVLPQIRAIGPLREALLTESRPDSQRRWDRSASYGTLDARVLTESALQETVQRVVDSETRRLAEFLTGVGDALRSVIDGDTVGAVRALRDAGGSFAEAGRFDEAAQCLEVALAEVRRTEDRPLEAQVLRDLGRTCWRMGRLEAGAGHYARAEALFDQLGDREMQVVASQGLGNVRNAQGRWSQAEDSHMAGLAALERWVSEEAEGRRVELLRGQLYNNLSQVTRAQERFAVAEEWQSRAQGVWDRVEAPDDALVACNNAALLDLARDNLDSARAWLLRGLSLARFDQQNGVLLTNLAQVELRAGDLDRAEALAREAEEFSVLCRAPDLLLEVYTVLGTIYRERGDDQGIVFFEKALQIGLAGNYPLPLGRAHVEYGRLRMGTGDLDEARAHFARASSLFRSLGAALDLQRIPELPEA